MFCAVPVLRMTDADTLNVKIAGPEGVQPSTIAVTYDLLVSLSFAESDRPAVQFVARDLFECMRLLRQHLEAESMILLCNGARVDAYPSQIARQMGAARRVHLTSLGRPTTREDLVDIFGEAPADKIGSVEEQDAFHKEWLRSLGWGQVPRC